MNNILLAAVSMLLPLRENPQEGKSYGTERPYTLGLEALQGPDRTDVYVSVKAQQGWSAPFSAQKLLLKSLDGCGAVRWAKNYRDVPYPWGIQAFQRSSFANPRSGRARL